MLFSKINKKFEGRSSHRVFNLRRCWGLWWVLAGGRRGGKRRPRLLGHLRPLEAAGGRPGWAWRKI